mmetsp:Transcript_5541/g.15455  ORF Transcript_5541/g.15455 Transcript_5541/m.15455 type:complete len:86 (+) Transcript_5541:38-295(+)
MALQQVSMLSVWYDCMPLHTHRDRQTDRQLAPSTHTLAHREKGAGSQKGRQGRAGRTRLMGQVITTHISLSLSLFHDQHKSRKSG